jgi:O-antigen/teichoic acid export membrane protein
MKLGSLLTKLAGFVGARILGAALGFASQFVLARLLPIEQVGVVILGMSIAAFIALGSNGGYALMALTELPKFAAHGRKRLGDAFNQTAIMDSLVVYLALVVIAVLATQAFTFTDGQKLAALCGFICAPASFSIRYNSSLASAARYYKTSYVPDFLVRPALFLSGLLIASLVGLLTHAWHALAVFVFVTFVTAVMQHLVLKNEALSLQHFKRPRSSFARKLRSRALALTIVSATMLAFSDIVILLGGIILPEKDLAVMGISMRLAAIAGFVLQAGQTLVTTDFSQALVRKQHDVVLALLKRINISTLGIVGAGLVGTLVLGDFALGLFGEEYRAGKWLLVLFMLGQSIRAMGGMNQQILSIHGYQLRTAGACVLTLVVLICLAVLLCKIYGPIGMGLAVVGAELVWLIALAAQAQSLCGTRGDIFWVLTKR